MYSHALNQSAVYDAGPSSTAARNGNGAGVNPSWNGNYQVHTQAPAAGPIRGVGNVNRKGNIPNGNIPNGSDINGGKRQKRGKANNTTPAGSGGSGGRGRNGRNNLNGNFNGNNNGNNNGNRTNGNNNSSNNGNRTNGNNNSSNNGNRNTRNNNGNTHKNNGNTRNNDGNNNRHNNRDINGNTRNNGNNVSNGRGQQQTIAGGQSASAVIRTTSDLTGTTFYPVPRVPFRVIRAINRAAPPVTAQFAPHPTFRLSDTHSDPITVPTPPHLSFLGDSALTDLKEFERSTHAVVWEVLQGWKTETKKVKIHLRAGTGPDQSHWTDPFSRNGTERRLLLADERFPQESLLDRVQMLGESGMEEFGCNEMTDQMTDVQIHTHVYLRLLEERNAQLMDIDEYLSSVVYYLSTQPNSTEDLRCAITDFFIPELERKADNLYLAISLTNERGDKVVKALYEEAQRQGCEPNGLPDWQRLFGDYLTNNGIVQMGSEVTYQKWQSIQLQRAIGPVMDIYDRIVRCLS